MTNATPNTSTYYPQSYRNKVLLDLYSEYSKSPKGAFGGVIYKVKTEFDLGYTNALGELTDEGVIISYEIGELQGDFIDIKCDVNTVELCRLIELMKEAQQNLADLGGVKKDIKSKTILYLDSKGDICHYQKGRLKLLNENEKPLYYETLVKIIELFPNDLSELSILDFNKKLSKPEKTKLEIKDGKEYKSRFSSAGRSFKKFFAINNISNSNPKNKELIINATDTKLLFNNKVE